MAGTASEGQIASIGISVASPDLAECLCFALINFWYSASVGWVGPRLPFPAHVNNCPKDFDNSIV